MTDDRLRRTDARRAGRRRRSGAPGQMTTRAHSRVGVRGIDMLLLVVLYKCNAVRCFGLVFCIDRIFVDCKADSLIEFLNRNVLWGVERARMQVVLEQQLKKSLQKKSSRIYQHIHSIGITNKKNLEKIPLSPFFPPKCLPTVVPYFTTASQH